MEGKFHNWDRTSLTDFHLTNNASRTFLPQNLIIEKHDLDYLMRLLERGKISPTITKRVSLEAVPQLHKDLESGKINGIFVCKPWKHLANTEID